MDTEFNFEETDDGDSTCRTFKLVNPSPHISTSGGELWIEDEKIDEYNLHIGELGIYDLTSADLSKLVIQAANHLITNGHRFEYRTRRSDNQQDLVEVDLCTGKIVLGKDNEEYVEVLK